MTPGRLAGSLVLLVLGLAGSLVACGDSEPSESAAPDASEAGEGDPVGDSIVVASLSEWPTVFTGRMPSTGEVWSVSAGDQVTGEQCLNVTLSRGGMNDCTTPPRWSDREVAVPLSFFLANDLESMLIVGLVPPQVDDVRLNDASTWYELEVSASAQVFALVAPRDLDARSLTIVNGDESVECPVLGPVRDLVYRC